MSEKVVNVFTEAGLTERDVRQFQKDKKLEHLPDKALVQLYTRVVNGKTYRKPYPVLSIKEIYNKVDAIANGTVPRPTSGKLFVGLKDVTVTAMTNNIPYKGCPICKAGQRKTLKGNNFCNAHPEKGPVEVVELRFSEWVVWDDKDEFSIKMGPPLSGKFEEKTMLNGKIWVEGAIALDQAPIQMQVNGVRNFVPGDLMGSGTLPSEDEISVDRSKVEMEGFGEEENGVEEVADDYNPFEEEKVKEEVKEEKKVTSNGLSTEFVADLRKMMGETLPKWARNPVKKDLVTGAMMKWVDSNYPNELNAIEPEKAKELLWKAADGLYEESKEGTPDKPIIKIKYKVK